MNALPPLRFAKKILADPDKNLVSIDGGSFDIPSVDWGRDFEITLTLDPQKPAGFRKVAKSLPSSFTSTITFWHNYIELITKTFCKAFEIRQAKLRFSQISHDQCTLFHTDYVNVRLFQTLQGPGTEYLLNDNLNRKGLGKGCNSKIVLNLEHIMRARTGDLLLMRGDRWYKGKGLVHRSPPIEKSGEKRLYLCLDAAEETYL